MLFYGTLTSLYSLELSSTIFNGHLLLHGVEATYSYIISTIISSTGDYYKIIWILVNGTYVSLLAYILFNIY